MFFISNASWILARNTRGLDLLVVLVEPH